MCYEKKNLIISFQLFHPFFHKKGFTLIELAIVLVMLGLITALGASLIGPLLKQAKLRESREIVVSAREAVIGYAMQYKMLPDTLSVAGARNVDAWGNSLYYYRDENLKNSNLCITKPAYTISTLNDNRATPPATLINKVVILLFSPGENGKNDTGSVSPFIIQSYSEIYDDIVEYIDIDFLRGKICNPFRITTDSLPVGIVETLYPSTLLQATDGTLPYTWSIVGQTQGTYGCTGANYPLASVNTGLCMSNTGNISGTPLVAGTYSFTVQAIDSEGRATTKSLTVTINPNNPVITTEFLNYGTVNQTYPAVTLSATGGKPPYTWSLTAGSLPSGLNLSSSGVISGTPVAAGTYSFTATVIDGAGRTASKTLSLTINPY